jgi:hypothetical protein
MRIFFGLIVGFLIIYFGIIITKFCSDSTCKLIHDLVINYYKEEKKKEMGK